MNNDTVMHCTSIFHPGAGGNKEFLLSLEGALDKFGICRREFEWLSPTSRESLMYANMVCQLPNPHLKNPYAFIFSAEDYR